MPRVNKKEAIELIRKGEFKMPGYSSAESIECINKTPAGFSLIPLFTGKITKENVDNFFNEYPTIEITE